MTKVGLLFVLFAILGATAACGGGNTDGSDGPSAPSGSGVDGTKRITDLTSEESIKICDFVAGLYGGYGKAVSCGVDGGMPWTITAPADRAECVAQSKNTPAACVGTVSHMESCLRAISTCDRQDDLPACAPVATCFTMGAP